MIKRIELLVHAGAPSKRSDDERYRAQAEAYASFNAPLKLPITRDTVSSGGHSSHLELADAIGNATGVDAPPLYVDTQLAYTALDSQLLTSSLRCSQPKSTPEQSCPSQIREVASGAKRKLDSQLEDVDLSSSPVNLEQHPRTNANAALATHESATDANVSTTSSYLKSPDLGRASKKAKLDVRRTRIYSEPAVLDHGQEVFATPLAQHRPVPKTRTADNATQRSEDSADGNQTTSELPTSYSLSDITSRSSRAKPTISQRPISDPGPQIGSISPTALRAVPTPRTIALENLVRQPGIDIGSDNHQHGAADHDERSGAVSTDLPASRDATSSQRAHQEITTHPCAQATTTNAPAPNSILNGWKRDNCQSPDVSTTDLDTLRKLSVLIQPQPPPAAVNEFSTHITETLRNLTENLDLEPAYRPVSVSRELRPLERGHWLIRCPEGSKAWPLSAQIEFWTWLDRRIGNGHAGWGVWCTREDCEADKSVGQASLGALKVFCWGEVVRHVYLLLYLASHSKVKKLGLQWIDAEGEVVIQTREG